MSNLTSQSSFRQFLSYALTYSPAIAFPAVMGLVSSVTFTRVFNSEEYGYFSLVLAFIGPLTVVLSEWAGQPIGRFYAEFAEENNIHEFNQTVILIVGIVLTVIVLGIGTTLMISSLAAIALPSPAILWGALALLLLSSIYSIFIRILPASFKSTEYRRVRFAVAAGSYTLALVGILTTEKSVAWLLWAQALATGAVLPYVVYHSEIRTKDLPTGRQLLRRNVGRFWRYGAPMTAWFFATQLLNSGDRLVIGILEGPSAVGIYSVNYSLVSQLSVSLNAIVLTASVPILMQLFAKNALDEAQSTISHITELSILVAVALIGLLAVVDEQIADILFGNQFRVGYTVMVPALMGSLIMGIAHLGHKGIEFVEKTHLLVIAAIVAAAANLGLNIVLIPSYGYVSAAYTSLASYILYAVIIHFYTKRYLPWRIPWKGPVLAVVGAVIAYIAAEFARSVVGQSTIIQVLIGGITYTSVFLILCVPLQSRLLARLLEGSSANFLVLHPSILRWLQRTGSEPPR